MSGQDGLVESNHRGFQALVASTFSGIFECSYITKPPSVHSKVYAWFENDKPKQAFLGSANYTQIAFNDKLRREAMVECSANRGLSYFETLIHDTIYCTHVDTENLIKIYNDKSYQRVKKQKQVVGVIEEDDTISSKILVKGLPKITVSLLDRSGEVPSKSGLNWGQREGREHNQAYLSLSSQIYKSDFFPERTIHFTVYTDDDKVLICTRAQDNAKAIQTPHNNSLIGEYFRNRLALLSGAKVTKANLLHYGRTDVDFYKIDDETYFMDFSV